MTLYIAFVQAPSEFIDVTAKMFRAGVMVDADQATLENGEHAFDAVRGHAIADVFASGMIDGLMREEQAVQAFVGTVFVGVDGRSDFDVLDCPLSLLWRGRTSGITWGA